MSDVSRVYYKEDEESCSWDSTDVKFQLAEQTGDSHLLLKEELRLKIQLKRLQEGKPEMEVSFEQPRQYELSEEEKKKQEKRKERNRLAAKNSRTKKKRHQQQVESRHKELNNENSNLRSQVDKLRKTAKKLMQAALESRRCQMLSRQPGAVVPLRQSAALNSAAARVLVLGGCDPAPLAHDDLLALCGVDLGQSPREPHELKTSAPRSLLQKHASQNVAELMALNNGAILPQVRSVPTWRSSLDDVTSAGSSSSSSYGGTHRYSPYSISRFCRPTSGKSLPSSADSSPSQSPSPGLDKESFQILVDMELSNTYRDAQPGI